MPETDPVAAALGDDLERFNDGFEDAVLLVARALGGRPDATAARLTRIDTRGVEAEVDGEPGLRVDFAAPVTDVLQVTDALLELLVRARDVSGAGPTRAEQDLAAVAELRTYVTTVSAVEQVHPHLRRITFAGGDLATFAPAGPDTFLYVLLPPPGRTALTVDQSFRWEAVPDMPEAERPVGAYYTLRAWRPEAAELDVLFVLHDVGPASTWAGRARPGDPVALWGPRTAWSPPERTERYLLVADETGLPAVARILEELPAEVPVQVVAEVADASEHQDLPARPSVEVCWLHRDGATAGTTTLLADAVRSLPWPDGTPYVWGGGESRAMTAVRRYVRDERGLSREAVSLVAYWRHAAHVGDPDEE